MPTKREVAEGFGTDAARYDRTRPTYPGALVEQIVATAPGAEVVDVGCGTGIAARQFRAAGCAVLGVEADPRMAAFARRAGFEVDVARFEDWDAGGRRFDALVSGQTWHWIDPVAGAAKAAEVLRPGGRLALFWNVMDPAPEIARAFAEVYVRVAPDLPFAPWSSATLDAYSRILDAATGGLAEAGAFDEPERRRFPWERVYTRDEWLEQVPTHGGHNRLPPEIQAALLDGIAEAVDAVGGRFTMRYVAVALVAGRRI